MPSRTGPSQEIIDLDDALQHVASGGIEAMLTGPAAALAASVRLLRPAARLLDVGGGTGSWSIAIARAHPACQCDRDRAARGRRRRP